MAETAAGAPAAFHHAIFFECRSCRACERSGQPANGRSSALSGRHRWARSKQNSTRFICRSISSWWPITAWKTFKAIGSISSAMPDLSDFETDGPLPLSEKRGRRGEGLRTTARRKRQIRSLSPQPISARTAFRQHRPRRRSDRARDGAVSNSGASRWESPTWRRSRATHGFDPYRMKSMRAIFFAEGPGHPAGSDCRAI